MTAFKTIRLILCAGVLGVLAAAAGAFAQEVSWTTPGPLGAGQRATLDLVFDDTQPKGAVRLPAIDGLSVVGTPSEASRISIVNGQRSASVTLSYPVRAEREGRIEIPTFDVNTTDGQYTVPALTVDVGAAMVASKGHHGSTSLSDAVTARMLPSTTQPYVGQIFDVDVVVALRDGRRGELSGAPEWHTQGIESEEWSKGHQTSTADRSAVRFRTRAVASKPGAITLAPAQQDVRIDSGRSRGLDDLFSMPDLADFFSRSDMSEVTVATDPVEVQVRPLPQPAPAGFSGAVGDFTLESKIVPDQPKVGEPVTWTLTLKGTGNWSDAQLPARAIPRDMRTLQPKQQRTFNEHDRFTGSLSEDLVLIPNHAGALHLEPVRFAFFNPQTERYETVTAQPPTLAVEPSAPPPQQQVQAPGTVTTHALAAAAAPAVAQPATVVLPHDPLIGSASAWVPVSTRWVLAAGLSPLLIVAGYWLLLAVHRARETDPRRQQREAFAHLRTAIAAAQHALAADQRKAALLSWQHAAAVLFGLSVAAPTAAHLRAARVDRRLSDKTDQWCELWMASERALYGRDAALDEWWYAQASTLCARIRLPRLNPLRAFLPHNLLPLAAATGLLLVCALTAHAEPRDEYRQGNFTAAQQQFAAQAAAAPADWVARYNLGLTAAQLGENARALGETAAAFVLAPRNEAVRWNLGVFAARVPGVDPILARVAFAPDVAAIARSASPAMWQAALIAACVALSCGAALALRRRYRCATGVRTLHAARALLACGAFSILVALTALRQYGPLANRDAAVVAQPTVLRSVPTDAEHTQQQTPLAAGTVVLMQKDFLGWVKIARSNGETGWLRRADVIPLYGRTTSS